MNELFRYEPFREIISLREAMDKLFEDSFVTPSRMLRGLREETIPAIDMYQTKNDVVVKSALPEIKPDEVDITISGNTLAIKSETKADEEVKEEDYIYREHRHGSFCRTLTLPAGLDTDKAESTFDDGILTVTIPKLEESQPKQIKVKAKKSWPGEKVTCQLRKKPLSLTTLPALLNLTENIQKLFQYRRRRPPDYHLPIMIII